MRNELVPRVSLDVLRQTWRDNAKEACEVLNPVTVDDGRGGKRITGTTSKHYPASRAPLGGQGNAGIEQIVRERHVTEGISALYLPHDADVQEGAKLVLNETERFEVLGVVPPRSSQVRRKVVVRLMGQGA